jgi:acyl-CoA thioesterase
MTARHPFDAAMALTPSEASPDVLTGCVSPTYWNMVGPFGGTTAATAVQALMQHPARLGEPLSVTVNFAAALGPGAFRILARPVRTNRSTQHWVIELTQADATGADSVLMTATAVTAARRQTWSQNDTPMPVVPPPHTLPQPHYPADLAWVKAYDMRLVQGAVPDVLDGSGEHSLSQIWLRDEPPRPIDFAALTAMADAFFPRIWLRRASRVPAGTVSLTVYFHAGSDELAQSGSGYLLGQAQAQAFRNGFFDQAAQLWTDAGVLLATAHQIVYYKE